MPALVRASLANTRGILPTTVGRVDSEKVAVLQAAIASVGDGNPRARARLLATLAVELTFTGDWRRCLALSDEALTLARALEDPEVLDRVLLTRYFPTCVPDLLQERLINTAELVASVAHVADPTLTAEAHLLRGRAAVEAGEIEEAARCYAIADQLSAGLGQPALRWRVAYVLAARSCLPAGCLRSSDSWSKAATWAAPPARRTPTGCSPVSSGPCAFSRGAWMTRRLLSSKRASRRSTCL